MNLGIKILVVMDVKVDLLGNTPDLPKEGEGSVLSLGVHYQVTVVDMIALSNECIQDFSRALRL